MIEYKCNKDNSYFNVDKEDVIKAMERGRKLITCPTCGSRDIGRKINIEKLMQERSAVEL